MVLGHEKKHINEKNKKSKIKAKSHVNLAYKKHPLKSTGKNRLFKIGCLEQRDTHPQEK